MKTKLLAIALCAGGTVLSFAQKPDVDSQGAIRSSARVQTHQDLMNEKAAHGAVMAVEAGTTVDLTINHNLVDGFHPRVVDGVLMVPARFFESLGLSVTWLSRDKRVDIRERTSPSRSIELDARAMRFNRNSRAFTPKLMGGTMYVALVPTLKTFGHRLDWFERTNELCVVTTD